MKIIFVCNEYPPRFHGGIGSVIYDLSQAFACDGHEVGVVELGDHNTARQENKVLITTLKAVKLRGLAWWINRKKIQNWLKQEKPDIVEIPDFQGMLPFDFSVSPVVIRLHQTMSALQNTSRILRQCELRTLKKHPHWIGVSNHILEQTIQRTSCQPKYSTIIHNAVVPQKPEMMYPPLLIENCLLYAGRLTKDKGIEFVTELIKRILPDRSHIGIIFAGYADKKTKIHIKKSLSKITEGGFYFTGVISRAQLAFLMQHARLLLAPGLKESFSMVAAEGMTYGCPVFAPEIPPYTEIVENDKNGFLLPPGNLEAWEEKIKESLTQTEILRKIRLHNLEKSPQKFSMTRMCQETLDFYNSIIRSSC